MIKYLKNVDLNLEDIILVFEKSSINRPIGNKNRIKSMFDNSNLIISPGIKINLLVYVEHLLILVIVVFYPI